MGHGKSHARKYVVLGGIAGMDIPYIPISFRQSIFDVYLGLTVAGYELAAPSRAGRINKAIAAASWPPDLRLYFGRARLAAGSPALFRAGPLGRRAD
ncbi:MAG TPA: hypothetical protein GXX29_14420 [Firmicutes bacterium]|nr:hypothetical protein [Bacillota bacterium]